MKSNIRILVVDDHPAIRRGLSALLDPEPDMEIAGCAATKQQAIEMWRNIRPDITLMDVALEGDRGGIETIRQIREDFRAAKIIVFSAFAGDEDVYQALKSGAITFLTKDTPDEELVRTIRGVHAGKRPIPPEIAQKLAARIAESSLSARELEVLNQVARGLRNKEIAATLNLCEQTVQYHLKNIFSKLQVNDRTAAVYVAVQRGLIHVHLKRPSARLA
jgi:DNA-binding NarL/FixJ family response regulator